MAVKYDLRKQRKKDYKKLTDLPLPRARRGGKNDALYELEVLEENSTNGRVKVHYTVMCMMNGGIYYGGDGAISTS